jgi:hypothetical protein
MSRIRWRRGLQAGRDQKGMGQALTVRWRVLRHCLIYGRLGLVVIAARVLVAAGAAARTGARIGSTRRRRRRERAGTRLRLTFPSSMMLFSGVMTYAAGVSAADGLVPRDHAT